MIAARVHLVLPKSDPLKDEEKPSSASVFIKHEADAKVSSLLPQIKSLVANSIEGLTYERVSVVFVPGERTRKTSEITLSSAAGSIHGQFPYLAIALICGLILLGGTAFIVWRGDMGRLFPGAQKQKSSGGSTDKP